ncbi:hypothetical protein EOPP23_06835 [Endozoicomonas sp. OPT23]|uniref:helix-turn-helix domain-containing protein n=1 Tax=Endozoicomonas sp. OPT23 TaxID=2072845 RepID=UPI00129AAF18|nr:hypothetical protein [Endozoicomonas sp. OPT23]MRI32701.1 hypothetical protein [Endozoicomonas sp. OPT23]
MERLQLQIIKATADKLLDLIPFLIEIKTNEEYQAAITLLDDIIDDLQGDYNKYGLILNLLSNSIELWENTTDEFSEFNKQIAALDSDSCTLRIIIDQHQLDIDSFQDEIGNREQVQDILNRTSKFSREQIQALANRFKISPSFFYD